MGKPTSNGMAKVNNPKSKLLCLYLLNSFVSNSSPAINMIYSRPIVEKRLIASDFSNTYNPLGPMRTPERMSPRIPGI
jgi:hypothetical protein